MTFKKDKNLFHLVTLTYPKSPKKRLVNFNKLLLQCLYIYFFCDLLSTFFSLPLLLPEHYTLMDDACEMMKFADRIAC